MRLQAMFPPPQAFYVNPEIRGPECKIPTSYSSEILRFPFSATPAPAAAPAVNPSPVRHRHRSSHSHGEGARITCARGEGARADAQGGEAGQEEEAPGPRLQAHAVQPPFRHRRRRLRQEARAQLLREVDRLQVHIRGSRL